MKLARLFFLFCCCFWAFFSVYAENIGFIDYNPIEYGKNSKWNQGLQHQFGQDPNYFNISSEEMQARFQGCEAYLYLHPNVIKLINQNCKNYTFFRTPIANGGVEEWGLYTDPISRDNISFNPERYTFFLKRLRLLPEDELFQHQKTKAINPATNEPWIQLSGETLKQIEKSTNKTLTDEEKQLINDVLEILNENFHYFYHIETLPPGCETASYEDAIGKYIPTKELVFGPNAAPFIESDKTEQQKILYTYLGAPVYSLKNDIHRFANKDSDRHTLETRRHPTKLQIRPLTKTENGKEIPVTMKESYRILTYYSNLDTRTYNIGYCPTNSVGLSYCKYSLTHMLYNLKMLCCAYGYDENQKDIELQPASPLLRALLTMHNTLEPFVKAICENSKIKSGRPLYGIKRLSDIIALPGVPGTGKGSSVSPPPDKEKNTPTANKGKDIPKPVNECFGRLKFFNRQPTPNAWMYIYLQSPSKNGFTPAQMKKLSSEYTKMRKTKRVEIIYISHDISQEETQAFLKKHKARFPAVMVGSKYIEDLPNYHKAIIQIPYFITVDAQGERLATGDPDEIIAQWKDILKDFQKDSRNKEKK